MSWEGILVETTIDDRCKKDWTKCGCCPVSIEWVEKQKEINKRAKENVKKGDK